MSALTATGTKVRCLVHSVVDRIQWLPPLLARVSVGVLFISTGWGKLNNLERVTEFFQSLGIPAAHLQAPFVATNEFVCGILLTVGLFTRLAGVPLAISMVVAILTAKKADLTGVTDLFGMPEYLYILFCAYFFVQGGGSVSLDRVLMKKFRKD